MERIRKDMIISEIIAVDTGLVPILRNHGMNCVGCPSAQFETLEQAATSHGMEIEALVEEMNVYLNTRGAIIE